MFKNSKIVVGTISLILFAGVVVVASELTNSKNKDGDSALASLVSPDEIGRTSSTKQISLGEGYVEYKNDEYGFSFEYPKELSVQTSDEGGGAKTIIFQKIAENEERGEKNREKIGFQVFITPIDISAESQSGTPVSTPRNPLLTKDQIIDGNPSAVVDDPLEVIMSDNIRGILFWGYDPSIGKTREIWFVIDDDLYEVTTYANLDLWLAKILSTWRFSPTGQQ